MAPQSVWLLNDKAINDYFTLLQQDNPSIYAFPTFFYQRYTRTEDSKVNYDAIKRWTKKVNIFSKSKVFFPINIVQGTFAHWVLVVADMVNKELVYYDSLKDYYYYESLLTIMEYLWFEHTEKLGKSFLIDDWKVYKGSNPLQHNGTDCGVFVCTIAEYLSRDAEFNFTQEHMLAFRKLIAYELTTHQLVKINVPSNSIAEEIHRITCNHLTKKFPNVTFG